MFELKLYYKSKLFPCLKDITLFLIFKLNYTYLISQNRWRPNFPKPFKSYTKYYSVPKIPPSEYLVGSINSTFFSSQPYYSKPPLTSAIEMLIICLPTIQVTLILQIKKKNKKKKVYCLYHIEIKLGRSRVLYLFYDVIVY